ncbi:MAG: hypothetical protein M1832_002336 [Thelocarpon impressellum]|nr:MAG: hypothetical protein M1832_002336 [Thelocarpon impressellum]
MPDNAPAVGRGRIASTKSSFRRSRKDGKRGNKSSPDRSKTSAAIRRGSVKISGPYPIKETDDDFPLRNSAAVFSITQAPPGEKTAADAGVTTTGEIGRAFTTTNLQQPLARPTPQRSATLGTPRVVSFSEDDVKAKEAGDGASIHNAEARKSVASKASTGLSDQSRRKANPIKAALQRLFSRSTKKGPTSAATRTPRPEGEAGQNTEHHRSDPGLLAAKVDRILANGTHSRAASAPFGEITKSTPLGSYAPSTSGTRFTEDLESPDRKSDMMEERPEGPHRTHVGQTEPGKARRASVPSVTLTGLAPRPASTQEKRGQLLSPDARPGASTKSGSIAHARRRSRSAGDLRHSEVRHLQTGERQASKDVSEAGQGVSHQPSSAENIPVNEDAAPARLLEVEREHDGPSPSLSAFPTAGEPRKSADPTNLETRVGALESRTAVLQTAVEELQHAPRLTCTRSAEFVLEDAPKRRSFRDRSSTSSTKLIPPSPTHSLALSHRRSFERSSHYNNVPITPRKDHYGSSFPTAPVAMGPTPTPTPTAALAQQPAEASPAAGIEHYKGLLGLLKAEQKARRKLERHVLTLQREMAVLRTPTTAAPRNNSTAYPTPSPEPDNFDRDDCGNPSPRAPRHRYDTGADDSSIASADGGYADSDDIFETPTEVIDRQLFGEDGRWEAGARVGMVEGADAQKARGLSLGHMTHPHPRPPGGMMAAFQF